MMFTELEQTIGYTFKNKELLKNAMCHSSYANEHRLGHIGCNERLEFLGDAVLGLLSAQYLFTEFSARPEGELTKMRAAFVCEGALCNYAREINLGKFLLLGRGEDLSGGRTRPSILADAFEALLAAMYLDSNIEQVRSFLLPIIARHDVTDSGIDYKTALQELVQQHQGAELCYSPAGESGPDHNKTFMVSLTLNGEQIGHGSGRSKKEAEQNAAKSAFDAMKKKN